MPIMQTVIQGGGSQPVIDTLNVTPTTSAQQITAPQGTDGYSPVNVSAVTSSIDANIQAGNIKNGVTILGTTGTYTGGAVAEPKIMMYTYQTSIRRGNQVDLNGAGNIDSYALQYACYQGTSPTTTQYALIGTQNLTTISGNYALFHAFDQAGNITSTGLSGVTSITGYKALQDAFNNSSITTADLDNLETVVLAEDSSYVHTPFGSTFANCSSLVTANLSKFKGYSYTGTKTTVGSYGTFKNCVNLTTVNLGAYETLVLNGHAAFREWFDGCNSLTTVTLSPNTLTSYNNIIGKEMFDAAFRGCTALQTPVWIKDISGALTVGYYGMTYMFQNSGVTSTGLSNITSITGDNASLRSIYEGCSSLVSTDTNKIIEIFGYQTGTSAAAGTCDRMFYGCTQITNIGFEKLVIVSGRYTFAYAFGGCTGLTNVTWTSLAKLPDQNVLHYCFNGCTGLQALSFPNLCSVVNTNQFANMLAGCSNVTVHFPSNMQNTMGGWASVTGGFGGTNTTVLFDLPEVYYAGFEAPGVGKGGTVYRFPTADTLTSLAWCWLTYDAGEQQIMYTSGTSKPNVYDYVYSDSACTTRFLTDGFIRDMYTPS